MRPLLILLASFSLQAQQPRNAATEAEARRVIESYFPLFNSKDVRGLLAVVNFPHVRVTAARTVIINSAKDWTGDPTPLEPYWHRSGLDSLSFVQSDAAKAHALVVFSRYKVNGEKYVTYSTLWS